MSNSLFQLLISANAFTDTNEIAAWYEIKAKDLGGQFLTDLENTYTQILSHPTAFAKHREGNKLRKKSLSIFPYRIFYLIDGDFLKIMAIIHHSRSEKFIRRKLK